MPVCDVSDACVYMMCLKPVDVSDACVHMMCLKPVDVSDACVYMMCLKPVCDVSDACVYMMCLDTHQWCIWCLCIHDVSNTHQWCIWCLCIHDVSNTHQWCIWCLCIHDVSWYPQQLTTTTELTNSMNSIACMGLWDAKSDWFTDPSCMGEFYTHGQLQDTSPGWGHGLTWHPTSPCMQYCSCRY